MTTFDIKKEWSKRKLTVQISILQISSDSTTGGSRPIAFISFVCPKGLCDIVCTVYSPGDFEFRFFYEGHCFGFLAHVVSVPQVNRRHCRGKTALDRSLILKEELLGRSNFP